MEYLISKLSEIRSRFNCFDGTEISYYRALSEAIRILSQRADGDTISRAAAVDEVSKACEELRGVFARCEEKLLALPSAQPETHDKRTETHSCDCISRQAAIDAVGNMLRRKFGVGGDLAEITIAGLPSAQPEQTDCEYCHEDSDGYVRPIEKNSHAWLVRRGRTMKLRVGFKGEQRECDIKFCPMCGRRLTDG